MTAHIIILTGEQQAGKTTVCQKTITLAQARGYTCGGLLTVSHADDVRDVRDARTGRARQLTIEANDPDTDTKTAVVQGHFRFDPETMAWGNDTFAHVAACHLLVVDELGPLEIERGRGWQSAFDALQKKHFALALVVVRPELVQAAKSKLPANQTTTLTVETHNRDDLPNVLLEMLEKVTQPARK